MLVTGSGLLRLAVGLYSSMYTGRGCPIVPVGQFTSPTRTMSTLSVWKRASVFTLVTLGVTLEVGVFVTVSDVLAVLLMVEEGLDVIVLEGVWEGDRSAARLPLGDALLEGVLETLPVAVVEGCVRTCERARVQAEGQ